MTPNDPDLPSDTSIPEPDAIEEGVRSIDAVNKPAGWKKRWKILGAVSVAGLLAVGSAWYHRLEIADNIIAMELAEMGLPAQYTVEQIGADRQILRNVVIGNPKSPDFTADALEVEISYRYGFPSLGEITLVKPRVYGRYMQDKLTFGSLDPVLFAKSDAPFSLPDLDVRLVDGRGQIRSDYGAVGIKVEGQGHLQGGFSGIVAATAPHAEFAGCKVDKATLFSNVVIKAGQPSFNGPVRLAGLECADRDIRVEQAEVQLQATLNKQFDGFDGTSVVAVKKPALGIHQLERLEGQHRFALRKNLFNSQGVLTAHTISSPLVRAGEIVFDGGLRMTMQGERLEIEGDIRGDDLQLGESFSQSLAALQVSAAGTLGAPLLQQMRQALAHHSPDSRLNAHILFRNTEEGISVQIPEGIVKTRKGERLLTVSRVHAAVPKSGALRLAGDFATSASGLPRITGHMAHDAKGTTTMDIAMRDYSAGNAQIAIPAMTIVQKADGSLGFQGDARVSGALPGGYVRNLTLPVDGHWGLNGGLSLWRSCTQVGFDSLEVANLKLDRRSLEICPSQAHAIVQTTSQGVRIAGGVAALQLSGNMGGTPIRIQSGPLGMAYPGQISARGVKIALGGGAEETSHFEISRLNGHLGLNAAGDLSGDFADATILLGAVPLDLRHVEGRWNIANGRVSLSNAAFILNDRDPALRFEPMIARDASLSFAAGVITADALLREPKSDRAVANAHIVHNLNHSSGFADLRVDGIEFDASLQPEALTGLAKGVVANADGIVRGTGRIDWGSKGITSSGRFSTDKLDFAAAFGPVKGARGEVVFTDLLGLVTAPDQRIYLGSINPGIEVTDGVLSWELQPNWALKVNGAQWPFLDGRLRLLPTSMNIGADETRRFVLEVDGLNAARFIERMEMENISATGVFDGAVPIVFDASGGRLEGGHLVSRLPGGSISYVGALTYEDLSPMANYAFMALRSLEYKQMSIALDGSLTGEIVTRVGFEGVGQGKGAKTNFITRQLTKLPIRFQVNVRAPFMSLMGSLKSFYDPTLVRDPRSVGLLDAEGSKRPIVDGQLAPIPLETILPMRLEGETKK